MSEKSFFICSLSCFFRTKPSPIFYLERSSCNLFLLKNEATSSSRQDFLFSNINLRFKNLGFHVMGEGLIGLKANCYYGNFSQPMGLYKLLMSMLVPNDSL